jgi:hypothetical protein
MPGSVPTFRTLQDIQDLGNQFRARCQSSLQLARENQGLIDHYIMIQDPQYPDDPTKRTWHPNMVVFYSEAERTVIADLCEKFKSDLEYWERFVVSENATFEALFNTTPKLDGIIAAALSSHMSN